MRRTALRRRGLIAAGAIGLALVLAMGLSVIPYRAPPAAPPAALARIAEKNRDAAVVAAASQRAEAAENSNAADGLVAARQRAEPAR